MISNAKKIVSFVRAHLFVYLSIFILTSIFVSSFLILKFEAPYPQSEIKALHDAIWWSAVGVSTIGIGNVLPVSDAGRYLTLFLMVVGVVVFSVITAKISSIFTEEEVRDDLDRDIKTIEGDLSKVEHDIEGEMETDDRKVEAKLEKLESRINKIEKK